MRGRSRSSSADSDGTPEKMITGTSAGVATTTSRPEPRLQAQVDDGRHEPVLAERVEAFVGGFRRDDREAVHFEKFHQRPANRDVVFDDQHEASGVFAHERSNSIPPSDSSVRTVWYRLEIPRKAGP